MQEPVTSSPEAGRAKHNILDLFYIVLTSPVRAIREVVERRPVGWAIFLLVILAVLGIASSLPGLKTVTELSLGRMEVIGLIILTAIFYPIATFIFTGIIHGIALLFKGRGKYLGAVCGLSFANLPQAFAVIVALFSLFPVDGGEFVYALGSFCLFIWTLILTIIAVKENYQVSAVRSIAILFAGMIISAIIIVLIAVSTAGALLPL